MVNFFIVCTGYNCGGNVLQCFHSIKNQTYQNFTAIMISDGSTDSTESNLYKVKNADRRIKVFHHSQNFGAAFQRYSAISKSGLDGETIILLLGMDDELKLDALETITEQYQQGKWMTYGNWLNQNGFGLPEDFALEFEDEVHEQRNYRKVKYRSTAPNTFKKFLFDQIPMSDFMVNGKWIMATTESEVMFSCLEMCGKERIGIIYKPIYIYNQRNKRSARVRMGSDYQKEIYNTVINRPKKNLYVKSNERQVA